MPRRGIGAFIIVLTSASVVSAQGSKALRRVEAAYDLDEVSSQRIINGTKTTIEANPWQVALVSARIPANTQAQFCGGSIIASRWVVTAAHCVDDNTTPSQIAVLTGTASLELAGHRVSIAKDGLIVHDKWNPTTHDFDIALVQTDSDVGGQAIKGARRETKLPSTFDVTVTGWGVLAWDDQTGSTDLMTIDVPYVPTSTCTQPASYPGAITGNMLCAGKKDRDSCQGDSGGPATVALTDGRRLVGIVSWGEKCGFPNKFGVYTRVSEFYDWIRSKTKNAVTW